MATHQILKKFQLETFSGISYTEQVSVWLLALEDYFDALDTEPAERISATPLLFRKNAKLWWRGFRQDFEANGGTWMDMKNSLILQFEDPNLVQNARDELARLKQTTSVVKYVEQFNILRVRAGDVSESEAIQRFRDGLKPELQLHFRGNPEHNQSLSQVQRIAGSLDNSWHLQRTNVARPYNRQPAVEMRFPQPMELDTAQMRRPNPTGPRRPNDRTKEEDFRLGNCFYCHERGHRAQECPRKKSGNARS